MIRRADETRISPTRSLRRVARVNEETNERERRGYIDSRDIYWAARSTVSSILLYFSLFSANRGTIIRDWEGACANNKAEKCAFGMSVCPGSFSSSGNVPPECGVQSDERGRAGVQQAA
jgi:hypothetical protein